MHKFTVILVVLLSAVLSFSAEAQDTRSIDHMAKKVKPVKRNNTTDHMTQKVRRKRNVGSRDHMTQVVKRKKRNNSTDYMTKPITRVERNNTTDHMVQRVGSKKKRTRHPDAFAVKVKKSGKTKQRGDAFTSSYNPKKTQPPKQLSRRGMRASASNRKANLKGVNGKKQNKQHVGKRVTVIAKAKNRRNTRRANSSSTAVRDDSEYHQQNHFMKGTKQSPPQVGEGWQKRKLFARNGYRKVRQKKQPRKGRTDDAFAFSPRKREKEMRKQRSRQELDLFGPPVNPSGRHKGSRGERRY